MPPKIKVPDGELTSTELRKLIRAHNILVTIKIPKGTDRDGLIALIKSKGYKVDHKKKAIIDSKADRPRRPQVTLEKANTLTKPKPVSEEEKKKRQQARQKKKGEKAFLKVAIPKAPPVSKKPSKVIKVGKPPPKAKTPAPKAKTPAPKASGDTVAGQLLDLPMDISDKIGKAVDKLPPSKEKMLKAYKIIGERKKKLNEGFESGDAFTTLVKYKTGKKKGQVKMTRSSPKQMEEKRIYEIKQIREMAKRFNLPYKNRDDNWDTDFRKKYGNDEANELSVWV